MARHRFSLLLKFRGFLGRLSVCFFRCLLDHFEIVLLYTWLPPNAIEICLPCYLISDREEEMDSMTCSRQASNEEDYRRMGNKKGGCIMKESLNFWKA